MRLKVAFASTDGAFPDLHFGQADTFHVYALEEDGAILEEIRETAPLSGHLELEFQRIYALLSDCDAIVADKIGYPVATYLIRKGLRVFESQFAIPDILNKFRQEQLLTPKDEQ